MTGVRRKGLQLVSPSSSSQQLPFIRSQWLWGHLHHNSCHVTPTPHLLRTAPLKQTHTHTHTMKNTRTHVKFLQRNARGENQKGIRDGCYTHVAYVWVSVNGTQGWGGLWYHRVHIARLVRVCHDGCGVERVTNPRFLTRLTSTGIPHHRDVGGPGDLWSSAALSYVSIVLWILY